MSTTVITDIPVGTPGSLKSLMDGLTTVQAALPQLPALDGLQPLRCYRWRPDQPDPPCLYNSLRPSTTEQRDLIRVRDTMVIATRIGSAYSDGETVMEAIETYADAYRALVDANYWDGQRTPPPLSSGATWAMRTSLASFSEPFGDLTLVGLEITQSFWLDRHVR